MPKPDIVKVETVPETKKAIKCKAPEYTYCGKCGCQIIGDKCPNFACESNQPKKTD